MLEELARKLSLVTGGRVLAYYARSTDVDVETAVFPVTTPNPDDRKETFVRKVASDFIRLKQPKHRVDARFSLLPPDQRVFTPTGEKPIQVVGKITLRWWPRPPEEDYYGGKPANTRK